MAVIYTNDLVLQLVEAYKNYNLLWDPANPDFKNKTKKNEAWDSIANTVNIPRKEVESKMHTLRSQFAREKKKIAHLRKIGRDDMKHAPWFAYEPMKFLLKGETEMSDVFDNSEVQSNHNDDIAESFVENFHIASIPGFCESTESPTLNLPTTNSRKRTNSYDDKSDDTMGYSSAKQFRPAQKSGPDEFEIFAQYVASELRQTRDLRSVLMAKHYINEILFKARMGKYRKDPCPVNVNRNIKVVKAEFNHNSDLDLDDE